MKVIIEVKDKNEWEVRRRVKSMMESDIYKHTLEEIHTQLFRPVYKNGYDNNVLDNKESVLIIEELTKMFWNVLEQNDVSIFDE
jgi:hypothetical protein